MNGITIQFTKFDGQAEASHVRSRDEAAEAIEALAQKLRKGDEVYFNLRQWETDGIDCLSNCE